MSQPASNIKVKIDTTNPGQFFACCGLLELADQLWPGAEGWFERRRFFIITLDRSKTVCESLVETRSFSFDVGDESESSEGDRPE